MFACTLRKFCLTTAKRGRGYDFNFTATVFHGLVELLRLTLQKTEWAGVLPTETLESWGEDEPPLNLL